MSRSTDILRRAEDLGTFLDDVISAVSPSWGAQRRAFREVHAAYDGATTGRRASNWNAPGGDVNRAISPFMWVLRARARDLVRNNEYASRASSIYQNSVIGTGIRPVYKQNDELQRILKSFIGGGTEGVPAPFPDAEMRKSLFGLQRLGEGERFTAGEILYKREWRTRKEMRDLGLPVPFQIRALEGEFLDESVDGLLDNGNSAVKGVEVDRYGRTVAYHLYDHHPSGYSNPASMTSRRVDGDDIIHLFREDRTGQVRGVTRLAPVMLKMRDYSQYEDVQLIRQKIAASYSVFLHVPHTESTISAKKERSKMEKISPGMIQELPPGHDVRFASPPGVDGFKDFSSITLHSIAAGTDLTYEQLTSDLAQVSFISGRMGLLEWNVTVDVLQAMWMTGFCWKFDRWFREGCASMGIDDGGDHASWHVQERPMLSPVDEIKAFKETIRNGKNSWEDEVRKSGRDPDEVAEEMERNIKRFRKLGLILDCDASVTTGAGLNPQHEQGE